MAKLSAARIETLKRNGGMQRFVGRPKPGARLDRKWCVSESGDFAISYNPEDDRWNMWNMASGAKHSIAGDSSVERINAHWARFCQNA